METVVCRESRVITLARFQTGILIKITPNQAHRVILRRFLAYFTIK